MSIRYPGGLITKTPVTPTTSSAPGVWTIEQALQYIKAGTWPIPAGPSDPDFEYVTLLLPGNGTNGAQNNTFLDSSTNAFTITRNGNTTQGTFSPYGDNWSNYFDGTGDYLQTSSGTTLGTGDFTVEAWVFNTTSGQKPEIWINGGQVGQFVVSTNFNSADAGVVLGALSPAGSGWSVALAGSTALTANTWNHIAWVRASGVITVYLNGVAGGTYSNTSNSISLGRIGAFDSSNYDLNGYISNLRVVAGTAVYTAAFTPPTSPLTAITNTSLLTCQSNRFIDNSTNAFTITVNGNTSVQRFSPFSPTASYASGTIGGSGYFDGSGDNLSIADNANLQFGTSDYTIEGWLYPISNGNTDKAIVTKDASGQRSWGVQLRSSYGLAFWVGSSNLTGTNSINLYAWTHFAVVRSGTSGAFFINGTRVATFSDANNYTQTAPVEIGGSVPVWNDPANAYIANVRLVKGSAVYSPSSTTLTVPTSPVTAITNTQLLCNMTNAGIIDNAMMNDLETVGNAQISTTQSKFGGSSMYFDGTGDYLVCRADKNLTAFGSGDWTIEFWIYFNAIGDQRIYDSRGTTNDAPMIYMQSGGQIAYFTANNVRITGSVLSTGTWYHIAVARSGTSTKMFVNGTQTGSTYTDTNVYDATAGTPIIGTNGTSLGSDNLNGYIDDLRITKGVARYTANFTPPTAAFPTR